MIALLALSLVLATLGAAFFRAQIIRASDFALRSDENRLRVVPIPAPRGAIYDRNGEIIAETLVSYSLSLEPAPVDSIRPSLARLAPLLGLDTEQTDELLIRFRKEPSEPVLIAGKLSFEQVSWLEEHRAEFPGMVLETRPVRSYPNGESVAHLVGYVGEISERELADSAWAGYRVGQQIGKAGLERSYERALGGTLGARYVEVDARGRTVADVAGERLLAPKPGRDVHLTLDLELQRFAHAIFPKDKRGAIVAMVPSTGEILALYSYPTYDPNLLIDGISPRVWKALNEDPGKPLVNRAMNGVYPPGSTWKLATALIGLERGVITPTSKMPISCTGGMTYAGRYSRCWKPEGHGFLDLAGAIQHSCNVYFYQLGIRLGLNQLTREGTRLGFARKTGLDLPAENAGTFPEGKGWYRRRRGWNPPPSEVMNLSIGQGPNSQTPLRMTQFYSALAGDGTAATPHLAMRRSPLPTETDLHVSPQTLAVVRDGLARVVEAGGTAHMASLRRWKLYGKTGTAQNAQDAKRPHAWFTGFAGAPGGAPEIAVTAVVEFGEHGGTAAAPLAAKVADFYLNRKHGLPTDSLQTLEERLGGSRRTPAKRPLRNVASLTP